jgi:5-methylcytosine-specific restriction endonuclease McrA
MPELRSRADDCCELCGAPIDFEAPPRTRRAPSVDHVVPLHAGGAELPPLDELRLAHVACNSRRGRRTRQLAPRFPVRAAVELRPDAPT